MCLTGQKNPHFLFKNYCALCARSPKFSYIKLKNIYINPVFKFSLLCKGEEENKLTSYDNFLIKVKLNSKRKKKVASTCRGNYFNKFDHLTDRSLNETNVSFQFIKPRDPYSTISIA